MNINNYFLTACLIVSQTSWSASQEELTTTFEVGSPRSRLCIKTPVPISEKSEAIGASESHRISKIMNGADDLELRTMAPVAELSTEVASVPICRSVVPESEIGRESGSLPVSRMTSPAPLACSTPLTRQDHLYKALSSGLEVYLMGVDNKLYFATEAEHRKALSKLDQISGIDFMTRPRTSLEGDFTSVAPRKVLILNVICDDQVEIMKKMTYFVPIDGFPGYWTAARYKKIPVGDNSQNLILWNSKEQILVHTNNDII